MTEKRFKMKKLEYESYFIDSQQEYVDEDEPKFKIDGEKTMSDSQILDLLNENEQLKEERDYFERKKCEYFNKYNKKHLDNIQLKEENDKLKAICKDHRDHAIDFKADYVRLEEKNEQLKQSINEVVELLSEEVDLFSEKATEHDMNAYVELQEFDNKDAYYMATATKKAIKMLKELQKND